MFKPMLAGTLPLIEGSNPPLYDFSTVKFPVLVSPKLDGVRMTVQHGEVKSRSLKPIANRWVNKEFGNHDFDGLDGELIYGEPTEADCFSKTVSALRADGPPVRFFVFDLYDAVLGFSERLGCARNRVQDLDKDSICMVPHFVVHNEEELYKAEKTWLEQGYEGLMLRSIRGPYKQGRSTLNEGHLLKLKRMVDSEAIVLGFEEGLHNTNAAKTNELGHTARSSAKAGKIPNGTLGKFLVRDIHDGREFSISGFGTAAECAEVWANRPKYLGKIIKYKHQLIGAKDKPRLPIGIGWRLPEDL